MNLLLSFPLLILPEATPTPCPCTTPSRDPYDLRFCPCGTPIDEATPIVVSNGYRPILLETTPAPDIHEEHRELIRSLDNIADKLEGLRRTLRDK